MADTPDTEALPAQVIAQRLDELTDLFRRRLVADREKQRAFDALYGQLEQARALADGQHLVPLLRRLINVIDRLDADQGELAQSVAEELVDILAQYEVERLASPTGPEAEAFDPRTQEVATVLDTADSEQDGTVAQVRRAGWRLGGARVLRPTLVDVHRYRAPEPAP